MRVQKIGAHAGCRRSGVPRNRTERRGRPRPVEARDLRQSDTGPSYQRVENQQSIPKHYRRSGAVRDRGETVGPDKLQREKRVQGRGALLGEPHDFTAILDDHSRVGRHLRTIRVQSV